MSGRSCGDGTRTTLASFNGTNGSLSFDSLIVAAAGDLFLEPLPVAAPITTVAYSKFKRQEEVTITRQSCSFSGANGISPSAGLTSNDAGNLFGTTKAAAPATMVPCLKSLRPARATTARRLQLQVSMRPMAQTPCLDFAGIAPRGCIHPTLRSDNGWVIQKGMSTIENEAPTCCRRFAAIRGSAEDWGHRDPGCGSVRSQREPYLPTVRGSGRHLN
jgi:hypothetical protein